MSRDAPGRPALAIVAAVAANAVIGAGNRLPWRIPADLRRFRALTSGTR
jgi:dihydrofolate reductase